MSSSAINTQVAQLKIGNVQNQADNSAVYSGGIWSLKNSTALTSVTITDAGLFGVGTSSFSGTTRVAFNNPNAAEMKIAASVSTGTFACYQVFVNTTVTTVGTENSVGGTLAAGTSPYSTVLANNGAYPISFATNNTERMRIDASGNLLVGKTVSSDSTLGFQTSSAGRVAAGINADNTYLVYNTSVGAYRFYVTAAGQINATSTSIAGISDVSLKENIRDLETGLSEVLALKPRRFDWKEETKIEQKNVAGFIAQEVEQVLPELIYEYNYSETEIKKSLKMGDMLPTLVKAIQEQQAMIESMKAEIAALKAP